MLGSERVVVLSPREKGGAMWVCECVEREKTPPSNATWPKKNYHGLRGRFPAECLVKKDAVMRFV